MGSNIALKIKEGVWLGLSAHGKPKTLFGTRGFCIYTDGQNDAVSTEFILSDIESAHHLDTHDE